MIMHRTILLAAALALATAAASAAPGAVGPGAGAPVSSAHTVSRLVAQTDGVAPGSTVYVALAQTLDKGWHTYWRNPGDAGEPTTLQWTLPKGWRAGQIVWPAPIRLPVGPIMNYGYEGKILLATPVEIPAGARPGQNVTVHAKAQFLVCAEVCIPGQAELDLVLPVVSGVPAETPIWGPAIFQALAAAPKPAGLTARFARSGGRLTLAVAGEVLSGGAGGDVYFFPYDEKLIDHSQPETVELGPKGLTLTMTAGTGFKPGPDPTETGGVLTVDGHAYEITATQGAAPLGAAGLGLPRSAAVGGGLGLGLAAVYALLGGLILNLMPCVFPILSMKAAALTGHGAETTGLRRQGLAFLAGVLITFLGLAAVLIAARAAGEAVGWGFELQSPVVIAVLGLVMLAAALNLSGLYEIGLSAQGIGGDVASRGGWVGSGLTGVLAVVVAAPCTAPFMGPALGYAVTQPPAVALTVFAALGLGFAAPFTLLAFSPALLRRLPRPGAWMETLKKALAFPMYGAAAWLVWVLAQQTNAEGLARMLAAVVALALAAWVYGLAQRARALGRSVIVPIAVAAIAALAAAGAVAGAPFASASKTAVVETQGVTPSQPWSPERLAALRAEGKPVLVNFTAAWCVTCQVNERVAFSDPSVAAALTKAGAVYLVADWTNRDPAIAKALADQGRIGVPLYLLYGRTGGLPKVLPQLLTPGILVEALAGAG